MRLTACEISQDKHLKLQELLHDWAYWIATRRFYAPYLPKNVLAKLQGGGGRTGREPNARNEPLCAAWNLVMQRAYDVEPEYVRPFLYVYLKQYRPDPIKALAFELGIDGDTVYQRAHSVATKYYNQAQDLHDMNAKMQKEAEGFIWNKYR